MIDAIDFDAYSDDEFAKFERIESPLHPRPDVCAFLLLHKLCPGTRDMIAAAEHDIFFLDIDMEELAKAATKEDIITLLRCGVYYNSKYDCLAMYT